MRDLAVVAGSVFCPGAFLDVNIDTCKHCGHLQALTGDKVQCNYGSNYDLQFIGREQRITCPQTSELIRRSECSRCPYYKQARGDALECMYR